jgi:hypothetical protein
MTVHPNRLRRTLPSIIVLMLIAHSVLGDGTPLPSFGRDTVLVWETQNSKFISQFVVRIAKFLPDRFIEWEDANTQGTIFLASKEVLTAKGFLSSSLFQSGKDSQGKNAMTLWLSQRIFKELKANKKAKCDLDNVPCLLRYQGDDRFTVKVNRIDMELPVIKVADDRGTERWFLDREDNPLMVRHFIRAYDQKLASITTDRPNTLRWIKGRKMDGPWTE